MPAAAHSTLFPRASLVLSLIVAGVALSRCGCDELDDETGELLGAISACRAKTECVHRRVLLVVVDTLKASGCGCYGYRRRTTPVIDLLAERGVRFERFYAASPWTSPAFGTIFTGVSPTVHRAGWETGKKNDEAMTIKGVTITPLRDDLPTLAGMLGGVPSGAIVTNSLLSSELGYGRGFDTYDQEGASSTRHRRADEVTRAALEWLERNSKGDFFLVVHYFDPHIAYMPPERYREAFVRGPCGRIEARFAAVKKIRNGSLRPTAREKACIRDLYDGEVRFVDQQIGELLAGMRRLDLLSNTWIAVSADHGEEHWEHGTFEHGHRYEDEVTRVPLVVRPACRGSTPAAATVSQTASHVDLTATVLRLFGREIPESLEGRSLLPAIEGEEIDSRPAYMEFNLYGKQKHALFDGRFKIVRKLADGSAHLYDMEKDPAEKRPLTRGHPRFARMLDRIREHAAELKARSNSDEKPDRKVRLSPRAAEALKQLGYVE
ncbi:MAG: sulfatase [Polyangia bacterium]